MEIKPVASISVSFWPFQRNAYYAIKILLGICAVDYRGDEQYPTPDTPGLIVDDVSCFKQSRICLLNSSFDRFSLCMKLW